MSNWYTFFSSQCRFFLVYSNPASWTWKTLPLLMMLWPAWMSTVITTCKKVIKVAIKSFLEILPKSPHLNQKPKPLLPLLHLKTIRMIWRNTHKSKTSTVWMALLVQPDPTRLFSISPMMAHQHPRPTVRRDIDVIKDQVHISLLFLFIFNGFFCFDFFFIGFDFLFRFWTCRVGIYWGDDRCIACKLISCFFFFFRCRIFRIG